MEGKILIIDDEESILDVLSECFADENYEVKTLTRVTDIVGTIKDFGAEVVLIDYLLRGENGGELCREIKKNFPGLPVVIMSAYPKLSLLLTRYPCDLFFAKPFDIFDLVEKVKDLKNGRTVVYNKSFA